MKIFESGLFLNKKQEQLKTQLEQKMFDDCKGYASKLCENFNFLNKQIRQQLMGQVCERSGTETPTTITAVKISNQLNETMQLQQKSQPTSPFSHLPPAVNSRIKELNYKPLELETIIAHSIMQLSNGVYFQGLIEVNQMSGTCRLAMPDGSYYQGRMQHNKLDGQGLLIDPFGDYYIGSFKNNTAEGQGIYVGDDFIYQGQFKKNMYSGHGKLTKKDQIFQGLFQKGKMKRGKLTKINDQSVYEGEFQGNIENGFGKSTKNKTTYQGIFINGLLEGQGKVTEENGDVMICNFEKGNIVNVIRLTSTPNGSKQSAQLQHLKRTNLKTK